MPTTWNAIYLGYSATQLDPTEGNQNMENALLFEGNTYGSIGDPLAAHVVQVTAIDNGADAGILNTNNSIANDQISYDLGGGPVTQTFDAAVEYNATITYADGSTATVTAVIIQDNAGNLFLAPESVLNADTTAYEADQIRSITLNTATDYSNVLGISADRYDTAFVCFVAGTRIETEDGWMAVERLAPGDRVKTRDHGMQEVRWAAARRVSAQGPGAPVRIRAGALGHGLPVRDLWLSQQHRLLLRSKIVARMTGHAEVLIAAKKLCGAPGIDIVPGEHVTFCHFICDQHEIVAAEGALAETLYLGDEARMALGPEALEELAAIFPDIGSGLDLGLPTRPIVAGKRIARLHERHRRNHQPLLDRRRTQRPKRSTE